MMPATSGQAHLNKLLPFYLAYKERIKSNFANNLLKKEITPYLQYILYHKEGRNRISIYVENFAEALRGNLGTWLDDLEQAGYARATQGFTLEDVWGFTLSFTDTVSHSIKDFNAHEKNESKKINSEDAIFLRELLEHSNYRLSLCHIKRRDEIINRRREQLVKLHKHASKIISMFAEEKIWNCAIQSIEDIFGLRGEYLFNDKAGSIDNRTADFINTTSSAFRELVAKASCDSRFQAITGEDDLIQVTQSIDQEYFKAAFLPLSPRISSNTCILFVHNQGEVYQFNKFDWSLLNQLNYYTESVVSNCRMMAEISRKRKELRDLSRRLISIQEEERKRLAGDIHDTLTQALTGIGYKALLCQEIIERDPERLNDELGQLLDNVNDALRQSRQIIREIRPQVLDDLGVMAAIKKVLADFQEKSGVKVRSIIPEWVDLYSEASIALFRILQESLRNIERHALATEVEVRTALINGHLKLTIVDDGLGFDKTLPLQGFGLITMRERAQYIGGKLSVRTSPGSGTKIEVTVPLL